MHLTETTAAKLNHGTKLVLLDNLAANFKSMPGDVWEFAHTNADDASRIWVRAPSGKLHSLYASRFKLEATAGRKDDTGKLDMSLLDDMPNALKAVVEVMQWAVTKKQPKPYERGSWQGVHADRYRTAIKRHDRDACEQSLSTGVAARFEVDYETKMLHLAHIATSALMALENTIREMKEKK